MKIEHVRLAYTPTIYVTAEQAAGILGISIEKADRLLSAPDTYEIVKTALADGLQKALLEILQQMARQKWPQETVPVRVDCVVKISPAPAASLLPNL